ncbi:MAG: peptidoglycan-associated lipoprotein Pal [Gammaproteobacteria bacterium]
MDFSRTIVIAGLLALMTGCGGTSGTAVDDGMSGDRAFGGGGAESSGVDEGGFREGGAFDDSLDAGGLPDSRVIYFAFDDSDVDAASMEMLEAHGAYLAGNPGTTVRLEGHADERGSREYNIGLGERRAQAVRQVLLLQGVSSAQLGTVSYGEERPAALGSDEEAWSLNRRVEVVYAP